jgi:integral membrane protein (TIGR01906 family)
MVTFNKNFYYGQYEKNNLYEIIEENEAKQITQDIFNALKNKDKIYDIKTPLMTDNEKSHLYDVAVLIEKVEILLIILVVILALLVILFRKQLSKINISKIFTSSGIIAIVVIVLFGISSLIGFNRVFGFFHEVFFPQGNYLFPADSLLKTLFPDSFFTAALQNTVFLVLLFAVLFLAIALFLKKIEQTK